MKSLYKPGVDLSRIVCAILSLIYSGGQSFAKKAPLKSACNAKEAIPKAWGDTSPEMICKCLPISSPRVR
jgi:hypothetical protein